MKIYSLDCELVTSASLEETFAVFQDPYNLARITPPELSFRILTKNLVMRKGAEIDYQLRPFGVPMKWRTLITEYDPPHGFVDEAVRGPYALWRHRHSFRETARGTLVADHVDYALPFGPLGAIAHKLAVSKQLREIFTFRQTAIAELLGGTITQVKPPEIRDGVIDWRYGDRPAT